MFPIRDLARSILCAVCLLASSASFAADTTFGVSPEKEKALIAILRSDAPAAEKALACKQLAVDGSSASVADLGKLLPDIQLSSWARIALEAIPGPESVDVLRRACASLSGKLLVGTLNSIGVRRDAASIEILTKYLQDKDPEVASAAAVALGRIGTQAAAKPLRQSLSSAQGAVRSSVAEGCILCAERLHADGKSAEAAELYDAVRTSEVPKQRVLEATRGAILARQQAGLKLLGEILQSSDKKLFQLALTVSREFPGTEIDTLLAAELNRANAEKAALIVCAMADRPKTVIVSAVLKAAEQGPPSVRLAAITALGRVGDASCLSVLLATAIEPDASLSQAAKGTLADLSGEKVNAQIVSLLPQAKAGAYPLLIEIIGQRRIEATPALLKALTHSEKAVRSAALVALGETVTLKDLPVLISQVVSPTDTSNPEETLVAHGALKAASVRMPDREACAALLAQAVEKTSSIPTKVTLLEILGAVGGTKALATIGLAAKTAEPKLQDTSTRLLGEWMTQDAAPVLLDLAHSKDLAQYQVRALRGYIRIARQFVLPEAERNEMCRKAFEASRQPAEKKMVLEVLKRYPSSESLALSIAAMKIPELKEDATAATLAIAQKLDGKGLDLKALLATAGLDHVKLEIVKAEYGAGATQKDVTSILQKQAGNLPLITFASASYNTNFGGDPIPGSVKQLKIVYRINGKTGEASFAEDATIVLPMPK